MEQVIESGTFLSYLLSTDDDLISTLLEQYPNASDPSELPQNSIADRVRDLFRHHFFTPSTLSPPSTVEALMSRPLRNSSAIEFFLSTTVLFDAARRACLTGDRTHFRRTENYNIRPFEVLRVLQWMDNSCFGKLDRRVLPAAQFLAILAIVRGAKITVPREEWPSATQQGSRSPSWAVTLESRRHVHHDNLLADMRDYPSCLESFSNWASSCPLALVGPFASFHGSVLECFLLILSIFRAAERSPPLGPPCIETFRRHPRIFRTAIIFTEADPAPAGPFRYLRRHRPT